MNRAFWMVFTLALALAARTSAASWELASPNGNVRLTVRLTSSPDNPEYPQNKPRLYYRVEHGAVATRAVVIRDSPLGLALKDQDFLDGLSFVAAGETRWIEERYSMPHGKRRECRNTANIVTLRFRNRTEGMMDVDLRAYDDGVAFRYRLTDRNSEKRTPIAEATAFALPSDARLWLHPSDKPTVYAPAYETYYEDGIAVGTPSPTEMGWSFPVLFRTADEKHWGLITEANLGTNYFGARLTSTAPGGVYRIRMPEAAEGHGFGAPEPSSPLPWEMPWRVIVLGDSPGAMVESTLVTDLCAPTTMTNIAWIKPGRVAWSWWSDQDSPRDGAKQKRFVDFAAEMGWEYVLVDANWTIMDNGTIHDVLRHAKNKGVSVLLWYNSGGPHNIVTEKPRDSLFYPEVRQFELKMLKDWGVRGVKVDFFQSDKQETIGLYHGILQDAAEARIMVNFHGCTLPRGWSRTYPHLMSMEAVRGEECYIFDPKYPEMAPLQNSITPFGRNAVGPMDYTPVGLGDNRYPHKTTYAHELALTVLFETGWLHFADDPQVYRQLPDAPKRFLKEVPVAWDDTRFVDGYPGRHAVIARRSGDTWYLAGVNGRNEKLNLTLDLKKIPGLGKRQMLLIADGEGGRKFVSENRVLEAGEPLKLELLPFGGFAAKLTTTQ